MYYLYQWHDLHDAIQKVRELKMQILRIRVLKQILDDFDALQPKHDEVPREVGSIYDTYHQSRKYLLVQSALIFFKCTIANHRLQGRTALGELLIFI